MSVSVPTQLGPAVVLETRADGVQVLELDYCTWFAPTPPSPRPPKPPESPTATHFDCMMAVNPDALMAYDWEGGEFTITSPVSGGHEVPLFVTDDMDGDANEADEYGELYGGLTFVAAVLTAKHMEHASSSPPSSSSSEAATAAAPLIAPGATVIELGAGTGLLGLTAAALGAAEVVCTDLAYCLPNLRANIDRNRAKWAAAGLPCARCRVTVAELDWCHASTHVPRLPHGGACDLIVGSELVFVDSLLEPLVKAVVRLTDRRPTTPFIMGFKFRCMVTEAEIKAAFSTHFEWRYVRPEEMHPDFRVVSFTDLRIFRFTRKQQKQQ